MKRIYFNLFVLLITSVSIAQKTWSDPQITPKDIKAHIFYLASDEMKGRFSGTPEAKAAAEYIKKQFETYGLKPAFGDSNFQPFEFIEKVQIKGDNSLSLELAGKKTVLKSGVDFTPLSFSGNGDANGEVVFAGYGISASKLNYDDYAGLDVKGKIVLVLKSHPEHDSVRSQFDGFASTRIKAATAKEKGAAGIIFFNGIYPQNTDDQLPKLQYDGAPAMTDFPVLQIKKNLAEEFFKSAGKEIDAIQKKIDETKAPQSFAIGGTTASLKTSVEEIKNTTVNVGAILEGNDPALKSEYLVVGGHYDHLGIDQLLSSSMYKGHEKVIHNGADDNASGTTGVLEAAEKFASVRNEIKRSIIFVCFSGEELGILGSTYFTNNSPVDNSKIAAMLNMDMIGRLNEAKELTVIGTGTSSEWKNLLNEKNAYGFKLAMSDAGSGGSDHQAFTNKNIPVLFFFTGTHSDYHKPSDDPEKINNEGEADVIKLVFDVGLSVANQPNKPDFVKVAEPTETRQMGRTKVTVGTVPEFGYNGTGYKLSGVTEGGPAAKAGIAAGDIIVKFGSKTIGNIYDFMYATQDCLPGDKVDIVVLRDGKEMTFNVELEGK